MADMVAELESWLKQVENIAHLSLDDQAKITAAGAKVFKEKLEEETRAKHYDTKHSHDKRKHLADDVTIQKSNVDNQKNGVSTVGWTDGMNATIARWLNDGSKKMIGDHFVTNLQNSDEVKEAVLLAEKAEYDKIIKKKG